MAIVDPWDSPRPPSRDDAPEVRAPAGVIDPDGGVLAAGTLANQRTLLAWLESDQQQSEVQDGG